MSLNNQTVKLTGTRARNSLSYVLIERAANRARFALGIHRSSAIEPLELFERIDRVPVGQILPQTGDLGKICISTGASGTSGEGHAQFNEEKGVIEITLSEDTYEGLIARYPRASYTLCHEIGHALLHPAELIRLASLSTQEQAAMHRRQVQHRAFEDTEWQANAFAGALLMPASAIDELIKLYRVVTPELLAQKLRVSIDAASYRLNIFHQKREVLLA